MKMKRTLLLCLTFCISLWVNAQATDLVVDCQTPGWLSSMINYGDQQSVKNLKVTGFINETDLKFIGTLIELRSLNGEIDLSDCSVVSEISGGQDNALTGFGLTKKAKVQVYRIPKTVTEVTDCVKNLHVDTLYFECNMKYVACQQLGGLETSIDYLILGGAVDSIPGQNLINSRDGIGFCGVSNLKKVHFPKTMKHIYDLAFHRSGINDINLNELENLDNIGAFAFSQTSYQPDTLWFKAKSVNASAFSYKTGQHIFIKKRVETIGYGKNLKNTFGFGNNLIFHMESETPPSGTCPNSTCTVYVPKGAKENYLKTGWQNANIIELNPVEKITLSKHHANVIVGETITLSAIVSPIDADDKSVAWSTSNEQVITVDANGNVKALKAGEAWVKVVSVDNVEAKDSCKVIAIQPVTGVSLSKDNYTFNQVGETIQLNASVLPEDASNKNVRWSSSNENVCIVQNGLVTAVAAGTATITATTVDGGFTANCIIKVVQHVDKVELNKSTLSLIVSEDERLTATVSPETAENKAITWSSSNQQIVSVDANGNVKALKAGEAWIIAVSVDNAEAKDSCKVTAIQPVTGISIKESAIRMTNIGENTQLEATVLPEDATNKEVKWSSTNEAVCVVSNGKVIATGFGTAVVIATTVDGGFMASCSVVVEKDAIPVTSIELSQTSATIKKGDMLQLTATVKPENATNKNIIWKSSDENVCAVTQTGLVIAIGEGKSFITVVPENGIGQAQCEVTVNDESNAITDIVSDKQQSNAPIYDIMGRKVSKVVKGVLYIREGKKFIAK